MAVSSHIPEDLTFTSPFLHTALYRTKTMAVSTTIQIPEMKNQTLTPTCSAIGLLKSSPIGIVTEDTSVSTENARPILSGDIVSCIYAVSGIVWILPDAPRQIQLPAKKNQPA